MLETHLLKYRIRHVKIIPQNMSRVKYNHWNKQNVRDQIQMEKKIEITNTSAFL